MGAHVISDLGRPVTWLMETSTDSEPDGRPSDSLEETSVSSEQAGSTIPGFNVPGEADVALHHLWGKLSTGPRGQITRSDPNEHQ